MLPAPPSAWDAADLARDTAVLAWDAAALAWAAAAPARARAWAAVARMGARARGAAARAGAAGRGWGGAVWRRLPEPWQGRAVDGAAAARAALVWLWLAVLALATVWVDPAGFARRPIPVRVGPARAPAAVLLVAAATPLQLRAAAFFWRNPRDDNTCQALLALLVRFGGDPAAPLDVAGAVVAAGAGARALPLAFRLRADLAAKTFTLTHAGAGEGPAACAHARAAARLSGAALDDALAPLLGRRLCPALLAGGAGAVPA